VARYVAVPLKFTAGVRQSRLGIVDDIRRAVQGARRAHPGLAIKNRFNIPDCPERVHWEDEFAREVGVPGAYDYGPERCSWLTHQCTNWMGDDGFLYKAKCQIRRHNPDGDVIFIDGTVTRKFVEDGKHLVEISQKATTHRGELSANGSAIVQLPSRGGK